MNIYFLFEGKSTETKVYPKYLSYLIPELKKVDNYQEVIENNYYIFSSSGYPSIYDDIEYAIEDIIPNLTSKITIVFLLVKDFHHLKMKSFWIM